MATGVDVFRLCTRVAVGGGAVKVADAETNGVDEGKRVAVGGSAVGVTVEVGAIVGVDVLI